MTKIAGSVCLFVSSWYLAAYLLSPLREHITFLKEGEYYFRIIQSEICVGQVPLPELFFKLSGEAKGAWNVFFYGLPVKWRRNVPSLFHKFMRNVSAL